MHWVGMMRLPFSAGLILSVSACNAPAPEPAPEQTSAPPATPASQPAPATSMLRLPSASRDPDVVLQAWADAVESQDWASVRAYWGDHGARSGLSEADFAARWSALKRPLVHIVKGEAEGAAGSLYYTAPVRITDGARLLSGEVVLRRVNDVDGASAEQLRWHIESTTLTP